MTDTEALKALVALAKESDRIGGIAPRNAFNKAAYAAVPALERMLASQTQDEEPVNPTDIPTLAEMRELFSAAPVASQMGEPDAALNEEVKVALKIMVEALMYGEAALNAAQTKMTMTGDLKGAGLMQPALDKIRSALKAEKTAAPAAGMDAEAAAIDICHELNVDDDEGNIKDIAAIIRKYIK